MRVENKAVRKDSDESLNPFVSETISRQARGEKG